jgi:aspartyl protease family protein
VKHIVLLVSLFFSSGVFQSALAVTLKLVALTGSRAEVLIYGLPRSLPVGFLNREGVMLVAIGRNEATFEVDGRRITLKPGEGNEEVVLQADRSGQFYANVYLNGFPVTALVDTGAAAVSINGDMASQMGIDYRQGRLGSSSTANGITPHYSVTLKSFKIGEITLDNVTLIIHPGGSEKLDRPLIGMSVLKQLHMVRSGNTLTLSR